MDIISFLLPSSILVVFSYLYFGGKRLNPIEKSLTPLFQEQCAGKLRGIYFQGSFIRHSIYEDFFILAYGSTCHIIKFSEVKSIELKESIFNISLIVHFKLKSSPEIIINSFSPHEVAKILLKQNVRVVKEIKS